MPMRLFLALPIADAAAQELAGLVRRLQQPGDQFRWSAPASWHVTLQFLGSATPSQYDCLLRCLPSVTAAPFEVRLDALDFFERAGIFHVAVQGSPQLFNLQQRVVAVTAACGFAAEARPYSPHITLARQRGRGADMRQLKSRVGAAPRFTPFTAREFLLYESFLDAGGSRYEIRARFPLRADHT